MPQQFVVPQFIDVEDKIFGPITTRQFIILLVTGIVIFIIFRLADLVTFIASLVILGGGALIFAFGRVNGQAFHYFVLNLVQTMSRPRLRVWHKEKSKEELEYLRTKGMVEQAEQRVVQKRPEREHIRDLSLVVNTGGVYRPEDDIFALPSSPPENRGTMNNR